MNKRAMWIGIVLLCAFTILSYGERRIVGNWFAGAWDSTMYEYSPHPQTVALRLEVYDNYTQQPLPGVKVSLGGNWEEVQYVQDPSMPARAYKTVVNNEPTAYTNRDGVVVFGLPWHKKGKYGRIIDDVERVRSIKLFRPGYRYQEHSFKLTKLIKYSDEWRNLIRETPGAKYVTIRLERGFDRSGELYCTSPLFFRKVLQEDYDLVFDARTRGGFPTHFEVDFPRGAAGPFIIIPKSYNMIRQPQSQAPEGYGGYYYEEAPVPPRVERVVPAPPAPAVRIVPAPPPTPRPGVVIRPGEVVINPGEINIRKEEKERHKKEKKRHEQPPAPAAPVPTKAPIPIVTPKPVPPPAPPAIPQPKPPVPIVTAKPVPPQPPPPPVTPKPKPPVPNVTAKPVPPQPPPTPKPMPKITPKPMPPHPHPPVTPKPTGGGDGKIPNPNATGKPMPPHRPGGQRVIVPTGTPHPQQ